jgi:hypothetical protein
MQMETTCRAALQRCRCTEGVYATVQRYAPHVVLQGDALADAGGDDLQRADVQALQPQAVLALLRPPLHPGPHHHHQLCIAGTPTPLQAPIPGSRHACTRALNGRHADAPATAPQGHACGTVLRHTAHPAVERLRTRRLQVAPGAAVVWAQAAARAGPSQWSRLSAKQPASLAHARARGTVPTERQDRCW